MQAKKDPTKSDAEVPLNHLRFQFDAVSDRAYSVKTSLIRFQTLKSHLLKKNNTQNRILKMYWNKIFSGKNSNNLVTTNKNLVLVSKYPNIKLN